MGLLFVSVEEEKSRPVGGLRSCRGRVTGKGARGCLGEAQALCKVVVRVFWRDLAEAGARRGERLLLSWRCWRYVGRMLAFLGPHIARLLFPP